MQVPRKATGNPPGRPPKAVAALKHDKAKQKALREALTFFEEMDVHLSSAQKDRLLQNGKASAKGANNWDDVSFPTHAMVPFSELQPLSAEELAKVGDRTKGVLGAIIAGFTAKVPDLLSRLASESPEKALKIFLEMQEFIVPKLSRSEVQGTVEHQSTFVAVEQRDADPRLARLPQPITVDVEVVSVKQDIGPGGDTREQGPGPEADATTAPSDQD